MIIEDLQGFPPLSDNFFLTNSHWCDLETTHFLQAVGLSCVVSESYFQCAWAWDKRCDKMAQGNVQQELELMAPFTATSRDANKCRLHNYAELD